MKRCTACKVQKQLSCFSVQAKGRFGVTSICKSCTSERGRLWHAANRERSLASKKAYADANRDVISEYAKLWRIKNAERVKVLSNLWCQNNRDKKRAANARRRAALLRAIPRWACMAEIQRFYTLAEKLTVQTGIKAHVDHIVPLQSKVVCGLHCPANLTILTEAQNKRKGNSYWPDMPTARMTKARSSSLIEYASAFCATHGVESAMDREAV